MASDLHNILQRIANKSDVLIEKYQTLSADKKLVDEENEQLKSDNKKLLAEIQRLRQENEYLRLARNVASSYDQIEQNKAKISKLVRDIDKCISQLTD